MANSFLRMWNPDNTFVFIILGDDALKKLKSAHEKNVYKYYNYSLSSYVILIKRLVIGHLKINEDHITILAKGEQNCFEINKILENDRIVVQLGINETYSTNTSQSEMNFFYFQNSNQIRPKIQSCIGNNQNANIILFLYDFGDDIPFLKLYLPLLKISHHSLVIFNESCYSKLMTDTINNYYAISEAILDNNQNISLKDLLFLAMITNKLYPNGDYNQLNKMLSLSKKFNDFNQLDQSFFLSLINNISNGKDKFDIGMSLNNQFSLDEAKSIESLLKMYAKIYKEYPVNYQEVHTIFQKGTRVIQNALKTIQCTNSHFLLIVKELIKNDPEFINNLNRKHLNHYIITSAHENGSSVTFPSIRIKKNMYETKDNYEYKIIAGSSAMSAFIIEALMRSTPNRINLSKIKELVYRNSTAFIREYAVESKVKKGKKKHIEYTRLYINLWKTIISPQEEIFYEQISNDDESICEIMKSIKFDLVKYDDPELEIKKIILKENGISEKENKTNYFGVQLADIRTLDKHNDDIEYYSPSDSTDYNDNTNENNNTDKENVNDNNDNTNENSNTNTNSNINDDSVALISPGKLTSDSSIEELILCDEEISPQKIKQIRDENKNLDHLDFSDSIFLIFKYELKKVTQNTDHQYSNQIQMVKPPDDIRCLLLSWVSHFFPSFDIRYHIDEIFSIFYGFMSHYRIKTKKSHLIFFQCMNVADQVVTPLHYEEKKSYIKDRLVDKSKLDDDDYDDCYDKFYNKYDDYFDDFIDDDDDDDDELKKAFNE